MSVSHGPRMREGRGRLRCGEGGERGYEDGEAGEHGGRVARAGRRSSFNDVQLLELEDSLRPRRAFIGQVVQTAFMGHGTRPGRRRTVPGWHCGWCRAVKRGWGSAPVC